MKFEEKDHKISTEHAKSGTTSEFIKIESTPPAGAAEAQFVHFYYETPPAPITDRLTAGVWVKAFRPGIQVKARVVFPKEKDPRNPDAPLTTLIAGKTYEKVRQWDVLGFGNVSEALAKQLPVLHARLGRAVDRTDAYIDRIVLNVHAGPGVTEVWIDDLEIGPVRTDVAPPQPRRQVPGASRVPAQGQGPQGRVRRANPGRGRRRRDGAVLHARHPAQQRPAEGAARRPVQHRLVPLRRPPADRR